MKPAVVLVDSETGERVPGIDSVWLVVGRGENGTVCSCFMEGYHQDGCPQGDGVGQALGMLIGHMLYPAVLAGADRDKLDSMWVYLRSAAEFKINHVLSGQGEIMRLDG